MRFRCTFCGPVAAPFEYDNSNGDGECPKCGRTPGVGLYTLTNVHFVVMAGRGCFGAIAPSRDGRAGLCPQPNLGRGMYVACQPRRDALAKGYKKNGRTVCDGFSATPDPRPVTCPACHKTAEWQAMAVIFPELLPTLAAAKEGRKATLDVGAAVLLGT